MDLKNSKICVTGGSGFLGSFVIDRLKEEGASEDQINIPRASEYDLRDINACKEVVKGKDVIIHLAAHVGGIGLNQEKPGELFYDNLMMGVHLIHEAFLAKVKKVVVVGTICAYPKFTPVPFKEEDLWNGYPEETNAPYGIAKKALLVQSTAYRLQYGFNSIFLLPVNLYGPKDNFNPKSSHVIPALIKKIYDAKHSDQSSIEVWGDGSPSREFLYVKDAAEGIVLATKAYDKSDPVNLGTSFEITIKDLVELIAKLMAYKGDIRWNTEKPNGQPRRKLDISLAKASFNFVAKTKFEVGLKETITWYEREQQKAH